MDFNQIIDSEMYKYGRNVIYFLLEFDFFTINAVFLLYINTIFLMLCYVCIDCIVAELFFCFFVIYFLLESDFFTINADFLL